jgi:predicted anti-sigma-YlaC factor YlaD
MKHCEMHQVSLSTFIDGELQPADALAAVDHLARCGECRAFYRDARALDELTLGAVQLATTQPVSADLWRRISKEASLPTAAPTRSAWRRLRPVWASVAAAALVVAIGLSLIGRPTDTGDIEIVIEQDRGSMTNERFVELTSELLRSDRRYHEKMRDVLELVGNDARREGSREDYPGRSEVNTALEAADESDRAEGGGPAV